MRHLTALAVCALLGAASPAAPARAGIDIDPTGLTHYAACVSQAKDRNGIYDVERAIMYRCYGEVAISYFNYLTRHHVRERVVHEPSGTIAYRAISGVGSCWNRISDEFGTPLSEYGCDIYVEL